LSDDADDTSKSGPEPRREFAALDQARMEAIEFKLAHLERAVQELSDVLYRQQRQLDDALELNRQLRQQLEELESRPGDATRVEIPPHY
jgi:uncharacterized coiled-coil protein SlyX